jgi:hypothetical protein
MLNRFAHNRQCCRTHACNAASAFHVEVKAIGGSAIGLQARVYKRRGA